MNSVLTPGCLEWSAPSNLQPEKGGRGWNIRERYTNSTNHCVCKPVLLSFVNCSYECCPFATILVLTSRKRGVWDTPFHPSIIRKTQTIQICFYTQCDSLLLTTRKWGRCENLTKCVTAPRSLTTRKRGVWTIERSR